MNRQDGATGLVMVLTVAVLLPVMGTVLAGAADLLVAAARARAAADAAALAGMATSPLVTAPAGATGVDAGDASPGAAARRIATANGAELTASDEKGWPLRYRVVVQAAPRMAWVRRIVGSVPATATAAVRPRTPSAQLHGV